MSQHQPPIALRPSPREHFQIRLGDLPIEDANQTGRLVLRIFQTVTVVGCMIAVILLWRLIQS